MRMSEMRELERRNLKRKQNDVYHEYKPEAEEIVVAIDKECFSPFLHLCHQRTI